MAGLVDSPTAIAARKPQLAPAQARFSRQNIVDASVSIGGRSFSTLIKEGASAEELIEKVAKENGGGVAKVYYPQFDTWEIVAVEIGGELLVKGDPKRVAEADFSAFSEPVRTKSAAMEASRHSGGGIHFSLGAAGIPIAMTQDLGVVFPNATELRVGSSTRNIALWMTDASFDPVSLSDLDRTYKGTGGVSVSGDALQKIANAHGGTRSDKLMLEDNLLVLNKDTGEIQTASQFSSQPMREPPASQGFEFRMEAHATAQGKPPNEMRSFPMFMMDGSPLRSPLPEPARPFAVRTFEASIMELLTVRFNPLRESVAGGRIPPDASERFRAMVAEAPAFAMLGFAPGAEPKADDGRPNLQPMSDASADKTLERKGTEAKHPPPANKPDGKRSLPKLHLLAPPIPAIVEAWARLRTEKAELGIPSSARTLKDAAPDLAQRAKTLKKEEKSPRSAKKEKIRHPDTKKKTRAEKAAEERRTPPVKADKPRPKAETTAKKREKRHMHPPAAGLKKTSPGFPSKSRRAKTEKAAGITHGMPNHAVRSKKAPVPALIVRPSRIPPAERRVKSERNSMNEKTPHLRVHGRTGKKEAVEKRKRPRKIDTYYFNQLMGLFRKKGSKKLSGRTAAGN